MVEDHSAKTSSTNICPHCHHPNRAGVLVCENCDRRMVERSDSTIHLKSALDTHQTTGAYPSLNDNEADGSLRLHVANASMSIKINPQKQTVLGRANPSRPRQPDVDLSAFKALECGVSSIHAMIDTQDGAIVIADLGSANGTFINGRRLSPHDMEILKDGDEIRMGKLTARIFIPQDLSNCF
jgi:pSer/pThr/pTyr-binding forkhead associated (FHA) protein